MNSQIHTVRRWIFIAGNVIFGIVAGAGGYALVVFLDDLINGVRI